MRGGGGAVLGVLLLAVAAPARAAQQSPHELFRALGNLRVDSRRVYFVRDLHLHRDAVSLTFSEGKLAFLEPLEGRVTGAVFTGVGHVIAIPQSPVEKGSLARFLGAPLLDLGFSTAYMRFTDHTAEDLEEQLREANAQPADEPSFATEWNPTVEDLAPWHSLRVMLDWLSAHPQPYFYAGLGSEGRGAFDILVDNRRAERVLVGQTVWKTGVRYSDVWASFSSEGSARPRASFLPLGYSIQTTILPDRTLEGKTTLRLKAARGGDRMVGLELSRYLKVESVTDATGKPLEFFQNEEVKRQEIARSGNDSVFVVLPDAPADGQEVDLQLAYRGGVISDAGNGVYFVGERGSWYPHLAGEDNFVTFDLTFRWPRKLQLVATGRKLDEREEGDWRVTHWRSPTRIPVAGFNLGDYATTSVNAGNTKIELYANHQIEQALADRLRGQWDPTTAIGNLPLWPAGRQSVQPVPEPLPPPSPAALLKPLGQNLADCLRFYEKQLGPFPFDRLAVSEIPGSFGQGWPGLLYLSTLAFLPPGTTEQVTNRPRAEHAFSEILPYHEMAHQWWGNVVGWSSYRDQWIEEALANYLALVYADSRRPADHVLENWLVRYRNDLLTKPPDSSEVPADAGPLVLGYRLGSSKSPASYSPVVYGKGTWVFQMIRSMLRDPAAKDPDARFWELLRALLQEYRYRGLSTDDLQRELEKRMTAAMDLEGDHSLDWFFDQWVRGTAIPRYKVQFQVKPRGSRFQIMGTLEQRDVPDSFVAAVPLYGDAGSGKPILLGAVVASGPETPFKFVTRIRPKRILIDPQLTLLRRAD